MSDTRNVSLRDYLRVLRYNRTAVVALTLLVAGIAAAFSFSQEPSYVAQARVTFQEENRSNAEAGLVMSFSIIVQLPSALTVPWLATRGRDQRLLDVQLGLGRKVRRVPGEIEREPLPVRDVEVGDCPQILST